MALQMGNWGYFIPISGVNIVNPVSGPFSNKLCVVLGEKIGEIFRLTRHLPRARDSVRFLGGWGDWYLEDGIPVQWLFLVPIKGGIGSIFSPPRFGKDYKWYISGIYSQLGDYMPPTTFYGNQKQPLTS